MQEQETVGQRFSQLISHLGISKNAFAASLEKTATVIQHIVDERNKPGFDLLCKIFEVYPNVSKDWMLQGQGTMLTDTSTPTRNAPVAATVQAATVAAKEETVVRVPPAEKLAATAPAPAPPRAESVAAGKASLDFAEASATDAPAAAAEHAAAVLPAVPAIPSAPAVPVVAAAVQESLQAALYAQQLAHQLTLAEMRNQHLQEQQRLMQQMLDMMQRQLSK